MSTTVKKRKADELESVAADGHVSAEDPHNIPHLPATIWGSILDYMPYNEVRSALLVGKTIANDAAKHVQTLNVLKATQMFVPAARRFPNVEKVNIFCLLVPNEGRNGLYTFSRDAATRIVPFLIGFLKLKALFAGGLSEDAKCRGYQYCSRPENFRDLYRGLIDAFCGAFKAGMLTQQIVSLRGISDCTWRVRECSDRREDHANPCKWCRDICTYFPLRDVISTINVCLSDIDRFKVMSKRQGCQRFLQSEPCQPITTLLNNMTNFFEVPSEETVSDTGSFWKRLKLLIQQEQLPGDAEVQFIRDASFEALDVLIESGFVLPADVSKYNLYKGIYIGDPSRRYDMWAKSTIDQLMSRGFAFDVLDLILVDDLKEPALKDLRRSIRGEDTD